MPPLVALLIAMAAATVILGGFVALAALRDVPEAREDEDGFWRLARDEALRPARVRADVDRRVREES